MMTTSPDIPLPLLGLTEPTYAPEASLAERFAAWVDANPHAVELAESLTRQWLAAGHERCAIDMIVNEMRWVSGLRTADASPWAINNNYRSGLARLLMERNPAWVGVFVTRAAPALERVVA